jgi:hypothetical protein
MIKQEEDKTLQVTPDNFSKKTAKLQDAQENGSKQKPKKPGHVKHTIEEQKGKLIIDFLKQISLKNYKGPQQSHEEKVDGVDKTKDFELKNSSGSEKEEEKVKPKKPQQSPSGIQKSKINLTRKNQSMIILKKEVVRDNAGEKESMIQIKMVTRGKGKQWN